jgi:acyl carrier protein
MTPRPADGIRAFVAERIGDSFTNDDDIFTMGFVNSLFAIELVAFIEKAFGFRIPNEELTLDNFRTVTTMAAVVERQLTQTVGA